MSAPPPTARREFKVNPKNVLGLEYRKQQNLLLQIALQAPSTYMLMRQNLTNSLLHDFTEKVYDMAYNVLRDGTTDGGTTQVVEIPNTDEGKKVAKAVNNGKLKIEPKFPEQDIAKVALSIAKRIEEIFEDEIVNKVLPQSLYRAALDKTAAITRSSFQMGDIL